MTKLTTRFPLSLCAAGLALTVGLWPPLAGAQTGAAPKLNLGSESLEPTVGVEQKIDLENIVLGAAKAVTTVQEAPAILTVISRDEIMRRGFRTLNETLTFVPGWQNASLINRSTDSMLTRGAAQSQLLLRDGISLFDPLLNVTTLGSAVPLEMIKRIEVVTGPGGVLWGANSYLGIISILTREGADVNGFEASAAYGGGVCDAKSLTPCGDSNNFKVYGIYGKAWGKLSVIQHVSFQTYHGPQFVDTQMMNHSPSPQPLGPTIYGDRGLSDSAQSFMVNVDGKASYGPFSVGYSAPWGRLYKPLHFAGGYVQQGDGQRWNAAQLAAAMAPGGYCNDPAHPEQQKEYICRDPFGLTRKGAWNMYDTLAYARYREVFLRDKLSVDVKGYYTKFDRAFGPTQILPSWLPLLQGGLMFATNPYVDRMGGTVDLDYKIRDNLRLLFGAESFRESVRDGTTYFTSPWPQGLPLPCPWTDATKAAANMGKPGPLRDPREIPVGQPTPEGFASQCPLQFVFDSDRVVTAGYADLQFKPYRTILLEAGYRAQAAPAGKRTYPLQHLASGAVVYELMPHYHLKVNYASGFRPPVFQNTDSNGEGVNYTSSTKLRPETSQSVQTEINARVLRNVRRIQGLSLRADYSYTILDGLIRVINGRYINSGTRGIHSAEFLAKLHLVGDHQLFLSYTYLRALDSKDGEMRNIPNHSFTAGAIFSLVKNRLSLNTNLTVGGAYEDYNRFIRPDANDLFGGKIARMSDQTVDRLPPQAVWQIGVRVHGLWKDRLWFDANLYNVLNQRYFLPDGFYDPTARLEQQPNPADSMAFFVSANLAL